jgi:2-keto-3-deoxy-6-phosphogluconate aldolase
MASASNVPQTALAHILADGLIADLAPNRPLAEMIEIGDALLAAPVTAVTIEMGHPRSLAVLAEYHRRFGPNLLLGAARIRTMAEYADALRVGAGFYMTHGLIRPVQHHAESHGRLCIPVAREIDELRILVARDMALIGMRPVSITAARRYMKTPTPFLVCEIKGEEEAILAARARADAIAVGKALLPERGAWSQADVITQARALRRAWSEARAEA